ncbi:MAG: tRNA (guanosine(37)-N1)-methyltransferase TrmD [Synergistaceae bacterium]|jgi:tRNA (guanine37-N1)-methyltransferase|nr:tRNA (guanosine(37)-N1)-methyltransferase TrmD [Synergistaceae bacterium]
MGLGEPDDGSAQLVRISVVTAFPDLVRGYLASGVLGRGIDSGRLDVSVVDIRDHARRSEYRQIDDYSFGGGGMVLMPGPLESALDCVADRESRYVVYPSPQGVRLHQELVEDLRRIAALKRLVIVCGRYEGVDERFVDRCVDMEVSMGDFVLTGGELPALALVDAISRLVRGVVGRERAVAEDSFFSGMLDHPHYTRPENFKGCAAPRVLLDGDRAAIESYRRSESAARTLSRRPEILARAGIMPFLGCGVYVMLLHHPVLDRKGMSSTTSVTGMDLHDIARACRTYGVKKYLVVTPMASQRELVKKVASHWITGYGADFNPDRASAMQKIKVFAHSGRALEWVEEREHQPSFTISTTAQPRDDSVSWLSLKTRALQMNRPIVFIFGTGHGLHEDVIQSSDAVMAPISGGGDYNHLSVRSAVSIVLDRFFGFR